MASWINILNVSQLNYETTYAIYNNFQYVAERFSEIGLGTVEILSCEIPPNTQLNLIMAKFNLVEQNIDNLHKIVDYPDLPYGGSFRWSNDNVGDNLYNGVNRWIDWLNCAKKRIDGVFESAILTDKNNKRIVDIDGKQILVYKEW